MSDRQTIAVIGGTGAEGGRYIISKDGKRDGESLWDAKDDETYFVRDMVNESMKRKKV